MSSDGFTGQVDQYLRDPMNFPPEYLWWLRRLIEDTAPAVVDTTGSAAGGAGIDFNKENDADASGADASYLWLQLVGSALLPHSAPGGIGPAYGTSTDYGPLAYMNHATGGNGGQVILNDTDAIIALDNSGDGIYPPWSFTESHFDGQPVGGAGGPYVGIALRSDGHGAIWLKSTGGPVIIENNHDVILNYANGHDINFVAYKISTVGNDFLIQSNQTITRDGSGNITAITPTKPTLQVSPGNGPGGTNAVWLYNLPTSATGLTTGQLWNSSGVLHIV